MLKSDTGRWWLLPGLILLSGALLMTRSELVERLRMGITSLLRPVQSFMAAPSPRTGDPALLARIRMLENRLASQQEQIWQLSSQLRSLRAFRNRFPRLDVGLVPADIIGRDTSSLRRTLIVDVGEKDGVSVDCAVVLEAALVGRVVSLGPKSCEVRLIDDPASAVPVVVTRTRDQGILEGALADDARLAFEYADRLALLKAGDLVLTSGIGGVFPKGIVVGKIVSATNKPGAMFKQVRVRPAVNLHKLQSVLIVTQHKLRRG